jgi:hypothetical protein
MATLVLHLLEICVELSRHDPGYVRMLGRWIWDAWLIANALEKGAGQVSFWDDRTGFYHDVIELPDGTAQAIEVFSMQAIVPLFAAISVPVTAAAEAIEVTRAALEHLMSIYDEPTTAVQLGLRGGDGTHAMMAVVDQDRLASILNRVLDPEQFLSPYGLRSLSKVHGAHPFRYDVAGTTYTVDYMPAESRNRMFGGNSNWRGPIWFPMNFLFVQSLNAYARFLGDTFLVPDPATSERMVPLAEVADHMAKRLSGVFVRGDDGRRAVLGDNDYFQTDPHWRDLVPFHEYFDGDTGRGLGASHQTGWTATVALLLQYRGNLRFDDLSH